MVNNNANNHYNLVQYPTITDLNQIIMKVEHVTNQKVFKPVSIQITFETERELELFRRFFGNTSHATFVKTANERSINKTEIKFDTNDTNITQELYSAVYGL